MESVSSHPDTLRFKFQNDWNEFGRNIQFGPYMVYYHERKVFKWIMFTLWQLPRTIESGMIQLYNQELKFEVSERSDSILQKHSKWSYHDPVSQPFSGNSPLKLPWEVESVIVYLGRFSWMFHESLSLFCRAIRGALFIGYTWLQTSWHQINF